MGKRTLFYLINKIAGNYGYKLEPINKPSKSGEVIDFKRDGSPTKAFIARRFNIPYGSITHSQVSSYKANPNITRNEILSLSARRRYKSIKENNNSITNKLLK